MVDILTGTPFDSPKRLNRREDEVTLEFPSSVSSRARGLLALKAQNWRASGGPKPPTPKYVGVDLIGSSVTLDGSILSGFTGGSYGRIPAHVPIGADPWCANICLTHFPGGSGGMCGLGNANGWTPLYDSGSAWQSYMNGIGWPVSWVLPGGSKSSTIVAAAYGATRQFKVCFTGTSYHVYVDGVEVCSLESSTAVNNSAVEYTVIGGNRGQSSWGGKCDLSRSYITIGDELWWEGEAGAYQRLNA